MTLLQSDLLLQVPTVIHGFTTKREDLPDWGNVSLIQGDPSHALDNRAKNTTTLDIPPEHLTFSLQEHGTTIRKVSVKERGAGADSPESSLSPADGLIANEPGLPLAIMVADCACILIAERNGQAVGAFHSGWRGTFENMPIGGYWLLYKRIGEKEITFIFAAAWVYLVLTQFFGT